MTTVPERIMSILLGEREPMTRDILRARLQVWGVEMEDRQVRDAYAKLAICSCNEGLFIPRTEAEVERYAAYIAPHVSTEILRQKMGRLRQAYPALFAKEGRQLTLGMEVQP